MKGCKESSTQNQARILRNVVVIHRCDESEADSEVLEDIGL